MPEPSDNEPPPTPPVGRRRAPTITIDTTAVSPAASAVDMTDGPDSQPPAQIVTSPPEDDTTSPTTLAAEPTTYTHRVGRPDLRTDISFDSRDSRPTSPHNVSSPVLGFTERGAGFLAVPSADARPRQNSLESEDATRSLHSNGETTVVASNSTQTDKYKSSSLSNEKIMKDDTALKPDVGTEKDFEVDNNPFAYTPGQLGKMFNPKSLAAFHQLGGLHGLEKGLRTDRKSGLSPDETHLTGHVSFDEATAASKNAKLNTEGSAPPTVERTDTRASKASKANEQFVDRYRVFRDNRLPVKQGKSLLQLMWITYNDKVLILLSIAAVISLGVGLYQTFGQKHEPGEANVEWVEGVAIIVAIAIVVIVGSLNDYSKERQFAKLNKKKQDRLIKVVRGGKTTQVSVFDLMAGDVIHLEPGDLVPVDGVLIDGFNIKCDESQTTGESDIITKRPGDTVFSAIEGHQSLKKMDPFIQSGSRIMEGVGTYMATSTGIYSSYGKTLMSLNEDPEMTPLQAKLNVIATYIAKLGGAAGLLLFIVLFIEFLVRLPRLDSSFTPAKKGQMFLEIFIVVVTIIVVAVPEGLPLAVTLALAFATTRMLKDANLVRHLKACEVMGNATSICSDKTGTLTQNKMQVVSGTVGTTNRFGGVKQRDSSEPDSPAGSFQDSSADITPTQFVGMLSEPVKELLLKSVALNSTAYESEFEGKKTYLGSKTEAALLLFARDFLGMGPVAEVRESATVIQMIPFDSGRKCMGIIVQLPKGKFRLYVKGASEIMLAQCKTTLHDPAKDDSTTFMTESNVQTLSRVIESYANRSLRTIGLCYRDFDAWPPRDARRDDDNNVVFESIFTKMTWLGIVGIQDPLRDGVYDAVKRCQHAGVVVRMVTGDNKLTAQAIAKEAGILQPNSLVMEGPEFRNLGKLKQIEIASKLHVLARSSPEDKRILVKRLKEMGEIVAVTGDGTNDAPALKTADVGFSMGIAGTEVAKEASAIILMDDNFTSIVKALKWGRAVNDAVKRFLQFQLTVNITAVVLTFVSAVSSSDGKSVLSAVQLLWVNLIMDTLAALALATDPPQESVLDRKPERKGASIISPTMWKMIIGQAIYQLVITFVLYYGSPKGILPLPGPNDIPPKDQQATLVFNTFVWMQIFNQWNSRRLDNNFNIFEGLSKNWFFIIINAIMCGGQVLIIFVGGAAFQIADYQSPTMWAIAIVLGFLSIPVAVIIRLIPDSLFIALVPNFLKSRPSKTPFVTLSSDEMRDRYPEPFAEVHDSLAFLRNYKGGRINTIAYVIKHPKNMLIHSRSPSRSRSNSVNAPQTPVGEDGFQYPATPESRNRSRSNRSRSNSALGGATVMAGLIAAGVAGAWQPADRRSVDEREETAANATNEPSNN